MCYYFLSYKYAIILERLFVKKDIYKVGQTKCRYMAEINHTKKRGKIKNLKISENSHAQLKAYCEENGLKIFAFIEKLIHENCRTIREEKNIYGD